MVKKELTIGDLKKDDTFGKIIESLETRFEGVLPEAVEASLIDIAKNAGIIPKQVAQWIDDFMDVAYRIMNDKANSSDTSICWIRLYEIVTQLPSHFLPYEAFFSDKAKISDKAMVEHIELGEKIRGCLAAILALLSEDEMITLEYERNCQAHIFQKGYRTEIKILDENKVAKVKTEYRGKPIAEVNEAVQRTLQKYSYKEVVFLRNILIRIEVPMKSIGQIINDWAK